jgi:hypothetical protein
LFELLRIVQACLSSWLGMLLPSSTWLAMQRCLLSVAVLVLFPHSLGFVHVLWADVFLVSSLISG